MNVYAVFIHYLGDAVSSLLVLGGGLLIEFFPDKRWVKYIDPTIRYVEGNILLLWLHPGPPEECGRHRAPRDISCACGVVPINCIVVL